MSDNPFAIADPFDPTTPDEETELRTLARALQFAEGFSLLFVRCHQHDQRRRLVAALRKELPQFNVLELHFDRPIDHLLHELHKELRQRLTQPPPDAVFVYGLEYSLPIAADAHATPFVANLNAARNSFGQIVPCPLVLWVPEYVLTAIMRGAPDFFSVRSGVYYFASTPQETAALVELLMAGEEWVAASLPLNEKLERIDTIKGLLADYQALPPAQRDCRAEARLLNYLGSLYWTLGQWAEAEKIYRQSLVIRQELGDRRSEGDSLNNLGGVYLSQGQWSKAETHYQQSLAIYRELDDRVGVGNILNNLGNVYYSQERWTEAEACYQQSLAIRRELGDSAGEGQTLNNLGVVYQNQRRWVEAEKYYQQSLAIKRELGDRFGEGNTRNNLGEVYKNQGRWAEAEETYEQSLAIRREVGDRAGEGETLKNFAEMRATQGNIAEALKFGRHAVEVLEITEDKINLEKARQLVAEWDERIKRDA
ncbi:tetratricopeptide repeat protein [Candidatus Poribacteria bacterium]|nr:tetratricopeptide repeat protein [Candidatus Poribacteria bacterium]